MKLWAPIPPPASGYPPGREIRPPKPLGILLNPGGGALHLDIQRSVAKNLVQGAVPDDEILRFD